MSMKHLLIYFSTFTEGILNLRLDLEPSESCNKFEDELRFFPDFSIVFLGNFEISDTLMGSVAG